MLVLKIYLKKNYIVIVVFCRVVYVHQYNIYHRIVKWQLALIHLKSYLLCTYINENVNMWLKKKNIVFNKNCHVKCYFSIKLVYTNLNP